MKQGDPDQSGKKWEQLEIMELNGRKIKTGGIATGRTDKQQTSKKRGQKSYTKMRKTGKI